MARPKSPKKNTDQQEAVSTSMAPTASGSVEGPMVTEVQKAKTAKTNGKPALVRTESRSNLVPISLDDEIRRRAYLLSERRGFEPGHETEDWLNAEREIVDRYQQQGA